VILLVKIILFPREQRPILVISSYIDKCRWITGIGHGDGNVGSLGALGEAALEAPATPDMASTEEPTARTGLASEEAAAPAHTGLAALVIAGKWLLHLRRWCNTLHLWRLKMRHGRMR
jgi:hypothetical protein